MILDGGYTAETETHDYSKETDLMTRIEAGSQFAFPRMLSEGDDSQAVGALC